ncbi:MAG: hypothetical protein K0R28_3598, partial [Paenibacillus sp.]|nr:hypothetical protein [Paenibacillus sp.]
MKPIASLGSRTELFVDDWLIESMQGVYLKLHPPERKEIVLDLDRPWEGNTSTYFTVIQEPDKIRLYYRGTLDLQKKRYAACYAESVDGVHFTRPDLQLHEFAGSRSNNIIWLDEGKRNIAHNLAPFLDPSPAALPEERYKAVGGSPSDRQELEDGIVKGGLHALVSCDGIHWRLKQEKEIMREGNGGQFDTLNTVLWDPIQSSYRSFSRFMREGARDIHTATSPDFLQWSAREPVRYSDIQPLQHYYTNSVILCPEAEHLYLAFPMRLVTDRKKLADHPYKG